MAQKNIFNRDTVKVPFSAVIRPTYVAGAVQYTISPNGSLSIRLATIADAFDEYRFSMLRYRLHRANNTSMTVAAFYPGIVDTVPSTIAQIGENPHRTVAGDQTTVPSPWVDVPRGVLAGMHPWYKSVAGTPESSEENQGILCVVDSGGTTSGATLEVEGICELRAGSSTSNTPLERAVALRRREKARLVSLLAVSDTVSTQSQAKK